MFTPTILRIDSLDSTNLEAARQAKAGAGEGLCIVAREQTAGRGRLDRRWLSPKDAGLYLSIVLRPQLELSHWPLISLVAGLAVSDALLQTCDLKVISVNGNLPESWLRPLKPEMDPRLL